MVSERFKDVGRNKEEKLRYVCDDELGTRKGKILRKLWEEKKRIQSGEERE